jgi:pimeloyl-ACP methyl ester carboxylesterase
VELAFVWGMLDPVSGAHMAERIRERLPAAPLTALDDVGHWPQLEAPERVAAALSEGLPA